MSETIVSGKDRKRLRIQGVRDGQPLLGPQTVHFDIANGCNVRCTTCWHHSPLLLPQHVPTAAWKRQQMPRETFQKIFDDLIKLGGLDHVILSGMGDPSLHPDLVEMVQYAHRFGIQVTIITNLLQVKLDQLLADREKIDAGMLDLLVSVCGVTSDAWNEFHAASSGFDKLLGQLEILKASGFRPKHVQVINAYNYHQLEEMVRFALKYPAKRINFKFASLAKGTEACALSAAQKRQLLEDYIPRARAIAEFNGIATDLAEFATQIDPDSHRTSPIEQVGCYMGTVYCRITVDLELLYCCNTDVSVGFITPEKSFHDLWTGPEYRHLRSRIGGGDFFPSCQQCGKYKQNVKWAIKLGKISNAEDIVKLSANPYSGGSEE